MCATRSEVLYSQLEAAGLNVRDEHPIVAPPAIPSVKGPSLSKALGQLLDVSEVWFGSTAL
jgi:hypothetical protein